MHTRSSSLVRFAWLSVLAAMLTISLKAGAYQLTGSVGLLSDALESVVNLVAAVAAVIALHVAEKEPDDDHAFGHDKAEYFSSGFEGALVLLAAVLIAITAIPRVLTPEPIEQPGLGLVISAVASLINLVVARQLFRAGKAYRSITLEADARHLMTDVWTSAGVIAGIGAVAVSGWLWLDSVIALAVAVNIVWTGIGLMRRSMLGLLDTALPLDERNAVTAILSRFAAAEGIEAHAVRTRQGGTRRFVTVHILVPGSWTVDRGHRLLERIERDIRNALPGTVVMTHLESLDDPASWADTALDRESDDPDESAATPTLVA